MQSLTGIQSIAYGNRYSDQDADPIYMGSLRPYSTLDNETVGELIRRFRTENDIEARNTIISHNLKLVMTIARKYRGRTSLSMMDLIAEGNLGLFQAIKKFDPARGYAFSTYATKWVKNKINRAIQKHSRDFTTVQFPEPSARDLTPNQVLMAEELFRSNLHTIQELVRCLLRDEKITREEIVIFILRYAMGSLTFKRRTLEKIGKKLSVRAARVKELLSRTWRRLSHIDMAWDEEWFRDFLARTSLLKELVSRRDMTKEYKKFRNFIKDVLSRAT